MTGRRPQRAFWLLVTTAVLAAGGVSAVLDGATGPTAVLLLAVCGSVLVSATALAVRVLLALERGHPRPRRGQRL